MIWGVLPGMLCRVTRECVLTVFFNCLRAVGFGAMVGHLLFTSSDEPPFVPPCLHPPFVQRKVQEEHMDVVECPLREASIGGRGR